MNLSEKGIIIRKTVEPDLPQIYSHGSSEPLFQNLPFAFNPENLTEIFSLENSICLTAARKKKVLGFIIGSLKNEESAVHWIMVKDKLRKTGIGKELLKQYIEASKKDGAQNFLIDVFKNNPESVKFFTGNGFSIENTFIKLTLQSD